MTSAQTVPGQVKIRCGTVELGDHWPVRAPGNIALLWFVTHRQVAIARGHGTVRVPRKQMTRSSLAVVREPSSVSVNITRPDRLAEYACASCVNFAKSIAAILSTLK